MADKNLMPIGKFSKSCRLSITSLRFYDTEGILKPAWTDPGSGYRYYSREQARTAIIIGMLRSLDLPLDAVKEIINNPKADIGKLLTGAKQALELELRKKQQALHSIERLTREGQLLPYEIGIREEPDYRVATLKSQSEVEDLLPVTAALMETLYTLLTGSGFGYEHPVMCLIGEPDDKGNVPVTACIGTNTQKNAKTAPNVETVKGGPAAFLTHKGSYGELGIAYHSLLAWAQEHGHEQRGAMREIYLNDPAVTPVDELLTEVLLPIF